ncbi:MAG: lysylphosphatidylglycerol synthase transmembrane domain-containing protein, partial [Actinobacteria bacterium]|nr:lysylphosphatidylglycerol synthase transmembrane domain-containing protein [Actinomycetota bacterium]
RSVSDLLTLLVTLLLAGLFAGLSVPTSGFEQALVNLIGTIPSFLDVLWRLGVACLLLWVVVILVSSTVRVRVEVLVDIAAALVVAVGVALAFSRQINGVWPSFSQAASGGSAGSVPLISLACAVAVSSAASPHLSLPFRHFGRWVVLAAMLCVVLLESSTPFGALLSLLLGVAAAAAVHLGLGSSMGGPNLTGVGVALAQLGLEVDHLVEAPRQSSGVFLADAMSPTRGAVHIKVYGRDARDTQLLSRLWRAIWYRGATRPAMTREQQVEHEGFVTMLAASRGIAVPQVLVAGMTDSGDALLAVAQRGSPLEPGPNVAIEKIWQIVRSLHQIDLVHGALDLDSFAVVDQEFVLTDLSTVTSTASRDQQLTDLAQTMVVTAILVGIERATVIAAEQLDSQDVQDLLAYLQPSALGKPLREDLKSSGLGIEAVRSALAAVEGVEVPEIAQLRRVSLQSLVMLVLLLLVAGALIVTLGAVSIPDLVAALGSASVTVALAALVVGQTPFFTQAVATRGACPRPIAYGPVALLQLSIGFMALAVPSTAGRLALDIRFFQRQGIPAASAVSIAAIDGFSGFLVQISLLLLTLVFGLGRVDLTWKDPTAGGSDDLTLLLIVAGAVIFLLALVAAALPATRNRFLNRVRPMLSEAKQTFRSLRSLSNLLQIFGGNLGNQILFALTLGICLRAFGGSLNLATLLVIYVSAALFGGLMPVPGGIGVMEAALMTGLIAAGIDTTTASATALLFRLVTFYLPPIWGWVALRWLQRHSYL